MAASGAGRRRPRSRFATSCSASSGSKSARWRSRPASPSIPNPRRRARDIFPRFDDNVRVLRAAYRTLADDVRTGQFVAAAAEWLLDNFHLVTVGDPRHPPESAAAPTTGSCRRWPRASTPGHARIYAMAVELIRHSDSRLDRQQLIAVPEQLPARRAADDRRAVGVAEHAEAGAHREPAPPGRRDCWPRAPRARAADSYVSRADESRQRPARCPPALDAAFVVQLLHRVREYGLRLSAIRARRRGAPRVAADDRRGRDSRRAPAAGASARCRWPTPITSLRLCATLDWRQYVESVSLVEQVLQRDPAGAYGRMDFLSRDRAAPGGRGAGRAERRGAGAGGAEGGRERAPGGRQRLAGRSRGPRRLSPRSIAGARDLEADLAYRPARWRARRGASCSRHATLVYLGADRDRDRRSCWPPPSPTPGTRARSPAMLVVARAARCCCRRATSRSRCVQRAGRPGRSARAAAAPRLLRRRSRRRPHDGRRPDDADQRRRRRRAARARRGAGARQPRSAHPFRDPQ